MANATAGMALPNCSLAQRTPLHSSNGWGATPARWMLPIGFRGSTGVNFVPVARWYSGGFNGNYKIAGQTLSGGLGVSRLVYIMPQKVPTLIIAGGPSNDDGTFLFSGLAAGNYIVLAVEPTGAQNAVVYDFVAAVSM